MLLESYDFLIEVQEDLLPHLHPWKASSEYLGTELKLCIWRDQWNWGHQSMRTGVEVMTKTYEWETRLSWGNEKRKKREGSFEGEVILFLITPENHSSPSIFFFLMILYVRMDKTRMKDRFRADSEQRVKIFRSQRAKRRCCDDYTTSFLRVSCKEIPRDFDGGRRKSCKKRWRMRFKRKRDAELQVAVLLISSSTDDWMDDVLRRDVKDRDRKEGKRWPSIFSCCSFHASSLFLVLFSVITFALTPESVKEEGKRKWFFYFIL